MPSSTYEHIPFMIKEILTTNPRTILDIGIGYGKWAFMCREYLESWRDRVFPSQWNVKIEGIEIFENYVNDLSWNKILYDHIYIGEASKIIQNLSNYDLIIAGDVIEHLPLEKGIILMDECFKRTNSFIASIPIGKNWLNNVVVAKNINEKHQAVWTKELIDQINNKYNNYHSSSYYWGTNNKTGISVSWRKI